VPARRLLLALRELSGGVVLTQLEIGASKVRAVACARFTVVLVPHAGSCDVSDVEALHIAHMLQLLYPTELGSRKRKGACDAGPMEDEYSAQQEMRSDIEEDLDKDAESDARFLAFQRSYLEPALSRPPASIRWLSPLAACPGVLHASLVAHFTSEQPGAAAGAGDMAGDERDMLVMSCPGLSGDTSALADLVHASICSQARGARSAGTNTKASKLRERSSTRSERGRQGCGAQLWEWIARWSRIACLYKEAASAAGAPDEGKARGADGGQGGGAGERAIRSFHLPVNSATSAFGSGLSVLVSPTGRRACESLALSLVLIVSDPSTQRFCGHLGWGERREEVEGGSVGWGTAVVAADSRGGAGRGHGVWAGVREGGGHAGWGPGIICQEEGLVPVSLPERVSECLCAAIEALDIAFPASVSSVHVPAAAGAAPPGASGATPSHPPAAAAAALTQAGDRVPVPPKRQRNKSAGGRRPPSRGRVTGVDQLAASAQAGEKADGGGGGGRSRSVGAGSGGGGAAGAGEGVDRATDGPGSEQGEGRSTYHIFSLSRPLTESGDSGGRAGERGAGGAEGGDDIEEPFAPEVGGYASRLRSHLRATQGGGGASGMGASGAVSAVGSSSGAGAGRSQHLRSSKLYTDLGFATPRKQEPASDTNPYRLVDLYQGTPQKGAARRGGGGGGADEGHDPDNDNGLPLSLDMLEGGGGGAAPVGLDSAGNGAGMSKMEGVEEEVVPSPATYLSNTLVDMAL